MTGSPPGAIDLGITGISDAVEIGAGGFGVVYRATEADLGRTVAVKVLSGNLDESGRNRFERERRAMGTLSGHPNIVTVYRGGYTAAGQAYLVMEFLARGSLADRLHGDGPLPWQEALKLGIQLGGALETAHRAGVLHRDIKPGNILLSSLGNAKLGDFGIARLQGAPETRSAVVTASLAHAAPDIVTGARPSARSDVYSLASTMFELVLGRPAYVQPTDESMVPILARIAQDPLPPLPESQLPAPMFAAIERAMAKDPAQRPASALQFGQLLVEVERQLGQPATSLPIEAIGAVDADMTAVAPATGDHSAGPLSPPEVSSPHTADRQPPEPSPWPPADDLAAPGLTGVVSNTPATSGEIEQADEWVRARPPDEGTNRPPWLGTALAASAAGLVVAALALWLIFVQGGGDDQGGEAGPTVADVSTTAQIDETSGTTEAVEDDAPPGFVQIRDESDSIRFVVPTAWTDVENGPGLDGLPYLGASPDFLGGFRESFTHPGASVTIIDGIQDLDSVLDQFTDPGCTPGPERSPLDLPYPGLLEVLTDCGSTGATLAHLAFVDQDQDLSAFMVIQMFSREDLATVGSTISDSLVLRDDFRG